MAMVRMSFHVFGAANSFFGFHNFPIRHAIYYSSPFPRLSLETMLSIVDIHSRFLHFRAVALLPQIEIEILVPFQLIVCNRLHKFSDAVILNRTFVMRGLTKTIETYNMQMPFGANKTDVAVNASITVDMAQILTCARS